jgi:hypothetical protein
MTERPSQSISGFDSCGTRDGDGAGDHDQPYCFGWRPRSGVRYPRAPLQRGRTPHQRGFNTREYARMLVMPSRLDERLAGRGDLGAAA